MFDNPAFERLSISVSPTGDPWRDGATIQRALDAAGTCGGGTVRLKAGTYVLPGPVMLRSDVALVGADGATLRRPDAPAVSELAVDADTGEFRITPADASAFCPGMAVVLHDRQSGWSPGFFPSIVAAVQDGTLLLTDMLPHHRAAADGARVASYYPLVLGMRAARARVENLTLDNGVDDRGALAGTRTAALYLYHSPHCTVRGVRACNALGDGICVGKASVGAVIEECEAFDNTNYGIHPGSHSAHCAVRRCHIHHNGSDGLYVCWGIHHSTFEENDIHNNGHLEWRSGLSIGHKDTDNLIARNHVHHNIKHGISFRRKTEANGAHRNVLRENVIEDNGLSPDQAFEGATGLPVGEIKGCGIYVSGVTHDLTLERNVIRETRSGDERLQRRAVYLAPGVHRVRMAGNVMEGHLEGPVVDESGSGDHELQDI